MSRQYFVSAMLCFLFGASAHAGFLSLEARNFRCQNGRVLGVVIAHDTGYTAYSGSRTVKYYCDASVLARFDHGDLGARNDAIVRNCEAYTNDPNIEACYQRDFVPRCVYQRLNPPNNMNIRSMPDIRESCFGVPQRRSEVQSPEASS